MTLLAEKPVHQHLCLCGKFMPVGQHFCFNCWLDLPASIAYKMLDSDPGRRALAVLEAEAHIEQWGERSRRSMAPHAEPVPDRKTASTGEHD